MEGDEPVWEPMDFSERVVCGIDKRRKTITHVAYLQGGLCRIAYKLSCGHIMVDDCKPKQLGGTFFRSEKDFKESVGYPELGRGYRGQDFVDWAKSVG